MKDDSFESDQGDERDMIQPQLRLIRGSSNEVNATSPGDV